MTNKKTIITKAREKNKIEEETANVMKTDHCRFCHSGDYYQKL